VDAVAAKRDTRRGEESPDEEEAVPTLGEAESYEPPSRSHRRRVSFPFARREKKEEENEPVSAPDREPNFSIDELAVLGEQTGNTSSHHGLRERLLHDPATLLAAACLFLQRHGQYSEILELFSFAKRRRIGSMS